MLLTLQPPSNHAFKPFHDYSPPTPPSTSRFSPALITSGPAYPPPPRITTPPSMSTPHRGLPPPAALALPPSQSSQPSQSQSAQQPSGPSQPMTQQQPLGQLPAPPQQWHGAEDSMRTWLQAKAEEDKRRQEEERTAQESLRLEQRRIEHDILRTSLSGGIPPHLIPLVFAGMGGGSLPSASLEWAQRYVAQEQPHLQQLPPPPQQQLTNPLAAAQPASPMLRREDRQISHPYGHSHSAPAPVPSTPVASLTQQTPFAQSQGQGYPASPPRSRTQLPGPSALARTPQSGVLPRLNTGDVQILQSVPQSQSQSQAQPSEPSPQQSPGIYFHHWQPPTSQAPPPPPSTQPPTPSEVTRPSSPPKKRKAQGPPPATHPHHSPPYSQGPARRRAHSHRSGSLDQARRGRFQDSESAPRSPEGYGYVEVAQSGRRNTLHSEGRHPLPMPQQQQQQRGAEWRYEERTPEQEIRRREGRE
ncbi:hypothetical protein VE00_06063 [Pseudogymnoascus sp. WSF 3629]|nr:hypothetical protein VE00_06063 [Pseudogymnoascus sp. WSF 3629]